MIMVRVIRLVYHYENKDKLEINHQHDETTED